jgi:LmbE family N-acetylglucosaminyl deacetylase
MTVTGDMKNKIKHQPLDLILSDGPILIVAAHPDDEVIGLVGQLHLLKNPLLVHTTDGAPRNIPDRPTYAGIRRKELERALGLAGISPDRLRTFGAVDQESITDVAALSVFLQRLLAEIQPVVVVTHPYEGGHPDHDTAAFAVALAVNRLARRGSSAVPIVEFTSYHNGNPIGLATMKAGEFLQLSAPSQTLTLNAENRARKVEMMGCFASQQEMLLNFPVAIERFRLAPSYDFARAPHDGRLFYEEQNWGVSGKEWRRIAIALLHAPDGQL